jgi:hypothetical protein
MSLDGRLDSFTTAEIEVLFCAIIMFDDQIEEGDFTPEQDSASRALVDELTFERQKRR